MTNAVKLNSGNAANLVLDLISFDRTAFTARFAVMDVVPNQALVLRATGLKKEIIDYPEDVQPGDPVIIRVQNW